MAKSLYDATRADGANLLELMPIAAGGIVSKPLTDAHGLRQIVFAMDGGQIISEHRAPYVATVHVLDGRMNFTVAGSTREMTAHDWLVMPPNEPHDLEAIEPTRFLLTLAKPT